MKRVELQTIRRALRRVYQLDVESDAGSASGSDIRVLVAHQHRARQVEAELVFCPEYHAWIRLAVEGFAPVFAEPCLRVVRTVIDAADVDPARAELGDHPFCQRMKVVLRVVAASDPSLVRGDDWDQTHILRRAAQGEDAGKKLEFLDAPNVALVDVDDPVPVEEESPVLRV